MNKGNTKYKTANVVGVSHTPYIAIYYLNLRLRFSMLLDTIKLVLCQPYSALQ